MLTVEDLLRRRSHKQDKKNKNRKYGRNGRTKLHYAGRRCAMKNCDKLLESRRFDNNLGVYVPR